MNKSSDSNRNVAALLKCLGLVQANLANVSDSKVHASLLQFLQAIPRDGMSTFQSGNLDKMIRDEERRLEESFQSALK